MSGDNAGHRFDIASFTATSVTLAKDSDLCGIAAPYNTRLDVPVNLADDTFVIREHKTLNGLFPIDDVDTGGTVEGYNFVAPTHPVITQSIDGGDSASRLMNADSTDGKFVFDGSGARSLADQVQFWDDATATAAANIHLCYNMIFYLRNSSGSVDQWSLGGTPTATNEESTGLFDPARSAMYCIQEDDMPTYYIPSPISNAVN
jgi:hypothetical protein